MSFPGRPRKKRHDCTCGQRVKLRNGRVVAHMVPGGYDRIGPYHALCTSSGARPGAITVPEKDQPRVSITYEPVEGVSLRGRKLP